MESATRTCIVSLAAVGLSLAGLALTGGCATQSVPAGAPTAAAPTALASLGTEMGTDHRAQEGQEQEDPLPRPGMDLRRGRVAIVITDPQNDFLSPDGVAWGVVGQSVRANNTVENLLTLFRTARDSGVPVFVSPHYYYPHDHQWEHGGALETLMHNIGMFDRAGPLLTEGLEGSGADWLEAYKPFINGDNVTVCGPHKVFGPESNDLALQLRKRRVEQVILAGMSANLCVESHMRELVEQGFEVVVVSDATAAAQLPGLDGYAAATTNFRMIAHDVWTTAETKDALQRLHAAGR